MTRENLASKFEVKMGSERGFGFVFTGFFTVMTLLAWWSASPLLPCWLTAAAVFLVAALAAPRLLRPLNLIWFRFGLLLNAVISPIILCMVFYLVITPFGLLMRIFGARPLNLHFDRNAESYWMRRDPPGPPPVSMKNQF